MFHFLFAAQCADVVVPVATEQAMRYYQSGNILWILQQAFGLIVPILFLVEQKGDEGRLIVLDHCLLPDFVHCDLSGR